MSPVAARESFQNSVSSEFRINLFGKFGNLEIISILDPRDDSFWFTQDLISEALDQDRSNIAHIRSNHPEYFHEGIEWKTITFQGKRRVVFSEEGFLTILDMSSSDVAVRLRKWMRQQFRVKHAGSDLVVQAKAASLPVEDQNDGDPELAIIQKMLNALADDRRRIKALEAAREVIEAEQQELQGKVTEIETRIHAIEDGSRLLPGELTAIQMADTCGWLSRSGAPHNTAVILAATNAAFRESGWMKPRREQGPDGRLVEVQIFTVEGVKRFRADIDGPRLPGAFEISPNPVAKSHGMNAKRHVYKR